MNAPALLARLDTATAIHLPIPAPRGLAVAPVVRPQAVHGTARRNRYAQRGFGLGYGSSDGYARFRTFLATPSLSRYR
jgi:hypothetical protein